MNCDEIRERMAANDLSGIERDQVQAHLSTCPACREIQEALEVATRNLKALRSLDPPPSLRRAFLQRVARDRKGRTRRLPGMLWETTLGVIGASVMLLLVLILIYTHAFPPGTPEEPLILVQVFPSGRVVQTVHPPRSVLLDERGTVMSIHLLIDQHGKMEKILEMEGGSEKLQERYRGLLRRWTFSVAEAGDYILVLTIPEPGKK
ncbi:MAG TPA: anti-sigma factor [Thermoanaerobaculia bacterium]|nr:anti-sigma factor [Thermoanaerobaculia bacterium]HUM29325.1 anti-sigma factor [Thermoanaerobaculia bacterium]HXK67717.1 anti-sigma factor [Thermoanaerobaculia bacterium]